MITYVSKENYRGPVGLGIGQFFRYDIRIDTN